MSPVWAVLWLGLKITFAMLAVAFGSSAIQIECYARHWGCSFLDAYDRLRAELECNDENDWRRRNQAA